MRRLLPKPIVGRGKQGFVLPFGRWFKTDLLDFAREVLLDPRTLQRGYFDPPALRQMLKAMSGADDRYARQLYALLLFEIWNRVFLDRTEAPAVPAVLEVPAGPSGASSRRGGGRIWRF
jgi:asparagine synthase (glutamine-hydrolysing)